MPMVPASRRMACAETPASAASVTRGECKTLGGKLIGVSLGWGNDIRPESARIDGDFFATTDDAASRALCVLQDAIVTALADPHADAVEALQSRVLPAWRESAIGQALVGVAPEAVVIAAARAYLAMTPGGEMTPSGEATDSTQLLPQPQLEQPCDSRDDHTGRMAASAPLQSRWQESPWGVVTDPEPLAPQRQMDLDATLAQRVADGELPPFVRFWQWGGKAIVLGAYQSEQAQVNVQAAQCEGFHIVRRCTGGGTMVVEPADTITYSLYAPLSFVRGLDPLHAYALCDEWLVHALRDLGVHASHEPVNDIASPAGKIGGGASRRFLAHPGTAGGGCFLHHVTLAYDMDAAMMMRVLRISAEKLRGKHVTSAAKRVDPLRHQLAAVGNPMTRAQATEALRERALALLPGAHAIAAHQIYGATIEENVCTKPDTA
ncbi:lipoate--protein ligase family protein [Pseudoscardovia suis]|uniref:lipoate--protein ligase family protein n=1 Tax=Pseudoscardovia suis TaxID=987063 RepID=UPI003F9951D9